MSRSIENRLASTLNAMAEQITESTTPERPLNLEQPVDLMRFTQPTVVSVRRQHRWVAPTLAAASVAALVVAGVALTQQHHDKTPAPAASQTGTATPTPSSDPTATSSPAPTEKAMLPLGQESTVSDVPWSQIGPGWTLAVVTATPSDTVGKLYMVDPLGGRYLVTGHSALPAAWSPDGQRALFVSYDNKAHGFTILERDLRTFTLLHATGFAENGNLSSVSYTTPLGKAMVVATQADGSQLATYTKYGTDGTLQTRYPSSTRALGRLTGKPVYAPDGLHFFLGAAHGVAYLGNGGEVSREVVAPTGFDSCTPGHMVDNGTLSLTCAATGNASVSDVFTLEVGASHFMRVTTTNVDARQGLGFLDEYPTAHGTFLITAQGCGGVTLSKLNADGTARAADIPLPKGAAGHLSPVAVGEDAVIFSTSGCVGVGRTLVLYDLMTGTSHAIVGPGATSGVLSDAKPFDYGMGGWNL